MFGAELSRFAVGLPSINAFDPPAFVSNPLDADSLYRLMTARGKQVFTMLPHHSGPESGIVELLNQRRDDPPVRCLPGADERVAQRFAQRQILDPLRGPIGGDLIARDAPDLLGVRLEENLVEAVAETIGDPLLEIGLFGMWEESR